jgi:hypothetical protein
VVSRCFPWACRSEGQPVQDDFRRPRESYQEALDFTQANNRVLVDRVKSLGRVLRIGRMTRAVVVPLASGGSQEDNRVQPRRAAVATHPFGSPARPHLRGFSSHAALTRLSPTASTPPEQNPLTWHYALILDWPGRPRTVSTTCAMWYPVRDRGSGPGPLLARQSGIAGCSTVSDSRV